MARKFLLLSLLLISLSSLEIRAQSKAASQPNDDLKIGVVRNKSLLNECGCSLALGVADESKDRFVFMSDMGRKAIVNLNGKDLKLRLIASKKGSDDPKVRDRSWEIYAAGEVKVRVDFTVRELCNPDDEACEVIYYKATLTVTRKTQKAIVKTVGLCGC